MNKLFRKVVSLWWKVWGWKPLYWLRCHTVTRYHLVDVRGEEGYKWGWIDRSHLMYLACFKILRDFVEKESPEVGTTKYSDYVTDPEHHEWYPGEKESLDIQMAEEKEIKDLYDWWTKGRAIEQESADKMLDGFDHSFKFNPIEGSDLLELDMSYADDPRWQAWSKEYRRLEEKDDEMFDRLMKIRQRLWT